MTKIFNIVLFLFVFTLMPVSAADEKVGDFDIRKVHQAIAENQKKPPQKSGANQMNVQQQEQKPESIAAVISRIAAYLSLIILVVLGIFWFVKRTGAASSAKSGGGAMDVLEILPIGQGRTIALVRVMDHVLILAQTQQNITMLDKIEGQKAVEVIASTKDGTSIVQFKDMFNNFVNKMKRSS